MKFQKGVEFKLSGEKNRYLRLEGFFQKAALFGSLASFGVWFYLSRKPAVLTFFFVFNLIFLFAAKVLRDQWLRLEKNSASDEVTGIMNRECFERMLEGELRRAGRYRIPLSVCLMDLDSFASFNTHFGRQKADALLKNFANFLSSNIRFVDCAARFGRDEFIVYLPHTDLLHAQKFVSRFLIQTEERLDCGFSAGLTVFQPGEKRGDLIQRLETALHQAKRSGKKQIHSFAPGKDQSAVLKF